MKGILAGAGLVGLAGALALARPEWSPLAPAWTRGVASGALLGTAGSLGGFVLLLRNLRGSHARFLGALFGGMLARWVVFGTAVVLVALGETLPVGAFLAGLVPSYLGFQAVEMWTLHRMQQQAGVGATTAPGGPESR